MHSLPGDQLAGASHRHDFVPAGGHAEEVGKLVGVEGTEVEHHHEEAEQEGHRMAHGDTQVGMQFVESMTSFTFLGGVGGGIARVGHR